MGLRKFEEESVRPCMNDDKIREKMFFLLVSIACEIIMVLGNPGLPSHRCVQIAISVIYCK